MVSKDEIKELLFDKLESKDRAWSMQLGSVSFELLYLMVEKLLAGGGSFIVDADFSQPNLDGSKLTAILKNIIIVAWSSFDM
jgi:hypothetical protein